MNAAGRTNAIERWLGSWRVTASSWAARRSTITPITWPRRCRRFVTPARRSSVRWIRAESSLPAGTELAEMAPDTPPNSSLDDALEIDSDVRLLAFASSLRLPVFGPYDQAALDAQYDPRISIPDFGAIVNRWCEESLRARQMLSSSLDIAFGQDKAEKLDVFHASRHGAPVQIFFHGGYWFSHDKSDFSFIANKLTEAGVTVVIANYGLCPAVTLDELVAQSMAAINWVGANARQIGGDPSRIHISGHSAGGQLVAMAMLAGPDLIAPDLIKGGCAL